MIWLRRIVSAAALFLLLVVLQSAPRGFSYALGAVTGSVLIPAFTLRWALRSGDRRLWRRTTLLLGLIWVVYALPPFALV